MCLKEKAELPIERWLGFFVGKGGEMKRGVFIYALLLVLCIATGASAVPITFTYTVDNETLAWYRNGGGGAPELLGLADNGNWRVPASETVNFETSGTYDIIWVTRNRLTHGDPGAFLAQVDMPDGQTLLSSSNWDVALVENMANSTAAFDGASFDWNSLAWDSATQYAQNDQPGSRWYANGLPGAVPGIDGDAWWIWYEENFRDPGAPDANDLVFIKTSVSVTAPVPEPSTMLLLSTGLIGLAGWGRRKFKKK